MRETTLTAIGVCAGLLVAGAAMATDYPARDPNRSVLGKNSLRAADVDKTAEFYHLIGMQEIYRQKSERFAAMRDPHSYVVAFNYNARLGNYREGLAIMQAWEPIVLGNAYIHMSIVVKDTRAVCQRLAEHKMPCERGPDVNAADGNAINAFVKDPDGRMVQLTQEPEKK
jgi:catechol-2,3-dioxygenase